MVITKEDIKKIEAQLPEFCFNFEKYPKLEVPKYPANYTFIEDIYSVVDNFQLNGKISKGYKKNILSYSFRSTNFYYVFHDFKTRKTLKAKIKGIVKLGILMFLLPFEFLSSFFYFIFK